MITSVHFDNFKALENFSLSLKDFNILVGLNNNGKSTILDAFRVLEGAYRYVSKFKPKPIRISDGTLKTGYEIPDSSIPIILQNISTNFSDTPATIKFRFSNGNFLYIEFPHTSQVKLYLESERRIPASPLGVKKEFPVKISIIPTLGPLEIEEDVLTAEYVQRWSGSRRAPRLFRNIWYHLQDGFAEFKDLVETTWPGMTINAPERNTFENRIYMFCEENRISREICWAGFGFQIWLQLLTHLIKAKNSDLLIVDEPEIYLHPDLQHKILDLLKSLDARVILATHSVEMINEAEPSEVVLIDKKLKSGRRISDLEGLQSVANTIGSGQNIQLTRLARGKKILFVEGRDKIILNKLSKAIGKENIFNNEITIIPLDGFSEYRRISNAKWAFSNILGENLKIAALFDRDYRCEEETIEIKEKLSNEINYVHILSRKELENYLLCPKAILKAIQERLKSRKEAGKIDSIPEININKILMEVSDLSKALTYSQIVANEIKYKKSDKKDPATLIMEIHSRLDNQWPDLEYRLKIIPGKDFLASLNERLQIEFQINISVTSIINAIDKNDLDDDFHILIENIEKFKIEN